MRFIRLALPLCLLSQSVSACWGDPETNEDECADTERALSQPDPNEGTASYRTVFMALAQGEVGIDYKTATQRTYPSIFITGSGSQPPLWMGYNEDFDYTSPRMRVIVYPSQRNFGFLPGVRQKLYTTPDPNGPEHLMSARLKTKKSNSFFWNPEGQWGYYGAYWMTYRKWWLAYFDKHTFKFVWEHMQHGHPFTALKVIQNMVNSDPPKLGPQTVWQGPNERAEIAEPIHNLEFDRALIRGHNWDWYHKNYIDPKSVEYFVSDIILATGERDPKVQTRNVTVAIPELGKSKSRMDKLKSSAQRLMGSSQYLNRLMSSKEGGSRSKRIDESNELLGEPSGA
ncbi:MAG: hypothetical protein M1825_001804 [Sarcosagium campestre]|nr:MAG: hypothetical protein M1825_001804 [Sarcosagium campestre]